MTYEFRMYNRPWQFDLATISCHVELWHGDRDNSVPIGMARYVAQAVKDCYLVVVPGTGHLLVFDKWREIFRDFARLVKSESSA